MQIPRYLKTVAKMVSSKFIALLFVVLGIVFMWTHFCSHVDFSLYLVRMNQDNLLIPGCGWRVCSGHLQMGKALKLLFIFVISIPYAVVVSGSFYKLLTHNKSPYKVINGHASFQFFQSQCRTVMSLNDYIRDRMNNNLGMHELMKYEWARYESFELYPGEAPLFPLKLACAGFYYTGENQTVKCFCCGEQFDADDYEELNEAHQRNSRNCSFVRGEASANIPIKHSGISENANFARREDQDVTQCRYPNYVTEESRRQTFRLSLHRKKRQIQEIVGAFFSTQELDINHRQETRSSDQISHDMRTNSAQTLLQMGYTEDRIGDAFTYLRRSGIKEITLNDLLDYIKTTEPNIYNRDSPSYTMLCTKMIATDNNVDQDESSQTESAQENERQTDTDALPNRLKCKICLDKEMCIVFLPCGHLVTCEDCAHSLQRCAICRAVIKGTVRTYLA